MSPSEQIDAQIANLGDWRGQLYMELRKTINSADPNLNEGWKWGTAVWSYNGNVVAVGAFKDHLKVNFFKGASLPDPDGLFNSGFDAKVTRSIDFHEGDTVRKELQQLVRAASTLNK